jgi:hypothetical protein
MILSELFTKPAKWTPKTEQINLAIYTFKTSDERLFYVNFEKSNDGWQFDFYDETYSFKMTNQGNAVEIFATVKDIALHFFKKYKPDTLVYFQAGLDEPSRIKLYDRAAKMIGPALPGYKTMTGIEGNHKTYLIAPEDSDEWDWRQDSN